MPAEKNQGNFVSSEDRGDGLKSQLSNENFINDNTLQSLGDVSLFQPQPFVSPTVQPISPDLGGLGSLNLGFQSFSGWDFAYSSSAHQSGLQIVFVDPGIHDLATLMAGLKPGMEVVLLDPHRDALDQIAETLNGQHNVAAVHIIAEGSSGQIDFSSGAYDLNDLTTGSHASDLTTIGDALGKQGDLMIWSCNTGQGAAGQAFIDALAQHTDSVVAASTGFVGAASLGASWTLDASTGPVHVTAPLTHEGIQHFDSDLGVSFSIIYPTYTPSTYAYAHGSEQVGFSYGTSGDSKLDNIYPSPTGDSGNLNNSNASNFTQLGSDVVFIATDATHGRQLWITDGTVTGTHLLDDINPSGNAFFDITSSVPMQVVGSELYFAANDGTHGTELWETDGVTTQLVKDINPGSGGSNPQSMVDFNGALFFVANDGTHGAQLWTSNGSSAGTTEVTDLLPAVGAAYASSIFAVTASGSHLFFNFNNGDRSGVSEALYVSDGTAGGTHVLDSALVGPGNLMTDINGTLYFEATDGTQGNQLWTSNGTQAGTTMVTDINPTGSGLEINEISTTAANFVATTDGEVFFTANDGTHGEQLWETDGTAGGTQMLTGTLFPPPENTGFVSGMVAIGNELYFAGEPSPDEMQLYETDGTVAHTQLVDGSVVASNPTDLTNVNGTLYFVATGSDHTTDLFTLDGSTIVEIANNFSPHNVGDSTTPGGGLGTFSFIAPPPAPTVSSLVAAVTSGANFAAGYTVTLTLGTDQAVNVAAGTTLSLSDSGSATYVSGSGTQTLVFTYSANDAPSALTVSSISAGSIANAADTALVIDGTAVSSYMDAVSDTAANVSTYFDSLDSAVSFISTITLTDGGTPNLDLTVSQALNDTTLIGKIGSSYDLVISDSAADVATNLDSLSSDGAVTAITLTDATPVLTVSEATFVGGLTALGMITNASFAIDVTGVSFAELSTVTGDFSGLANHSHATLSVAVSDSAADVSTNFDSLNSAVGTISTITLTDGGTPNLDLTAAQALNDTTLIGKIVSSYDLVVNDSAANIGTNFGALDADVANISSITFTDSGTPNLDLTASQALNDTTLIGKIVSSYDLVISDSAADVATALDSLSADGAVTAITLTDTTPVLTVSEATFAGGLTALGKIGNASFAIDVTGVSVAELSTVTGDFAGLSNHSHATLSVAISNSAADVATALDSLNTNAAVTSITLTDATPVLTVSEATFVGGLTALGKITNTSFAIDVTGVSVAELSTVTGDFAGLSNHSHATLSVAISDSATDVATALDSLNTNAAVTSITFTDATPVLTVSEATFVGGLTALGKIGNASFAIDVTGVSVAELSTVTGDFAGLSNHSHATLSVAISDSAADVATALDSLNTNAAVTSITLTDTTPVLTVSEATFVGGLTALGKITNASFAIDVTGVSVAELSTVTGDFAALSNHSHATLSVAISDSAADVATALDSLNTNAAVTSITLTDATPVLTVSEATFVGGLTALGKITNTSFAIDVTGVSVAELSTVTGDFAGLSNHSHATLSVAISDSAADVATALDSLNTNAAVTSITLTDTTPVLSVSEATFVGGLTALGKIGNASFAIDVTGVSVAELSTVTGDFAALSNHSHATLSVAISDSAADISGAFDALSSNTDVSKIIVSDSATNEVVVAVAQLTSDATALSHLFQSNGTTAARVEVSDLAANVAAGIATLEADATKIASIHFTDSGTPTLNLTQTQVTDDATVLNLIAGAYDLHVTGASGSSYGGLTSNSYTDFYNASDVLTLKTEFNTNGSITDFAYANGLTLNGNGDSDVFYIDTGLGDTINGGAGNDVFLFNTHLTSATKIEGGTGSNTVILYGDYTGANALVMNATTMVNVEKLILETGHSFNLTTNAATVTSGQTLTVDAAPLASGNTLTFNGSANTNGHFVFDVGLGVETLTGGALSDTFVFGSAADSTGPNYDTINSFKFALDRFEIPGGAASVTAIDSTVNASLSTATFNADMAAAVSGHLNAHSAMLVTANAGTLAGQTFLVIDPTGTAGYQSGTDLVIHLSGATGTLTTSDFI